MVNTFEIMNNFPGNKKEDETTGWHASEDTITASEAAMSVMVFRLRNAWFALKMNLLHKVADIALPHTVPGKTNNRFRGIVNAGGELALCFSLEDVLGITDASDVMPEKINRPRLVVIGKGENRFAFAVESLLGVRSLIAEDLTIRPVILAEYDQHDSLQVVSIDGQKVGLINEEKLFADLIRGLPDGDR
jgi:chemotaxis-related protein WspD